MNRMDGADRDARRSSVPGSADAGEVLVPVQPGWDVYGSDGEKIGAVHDAGRGFLEVEKGFFFIKDLYIPASAVAEVDTDARRVILNVAKDAVGDMGWTEPPIRRPGEARETWGQGTVEEAAPANPRSADFTPRAAPSMASDGEAGRVLADTGTESTSADTSDAPAAHPDQASVWRAAAQDESEPGAGAAESFDGVAAAGYTSSTGIPPTAVRSVDADETAGDADAALQEDTQSGPHASDGTARPHDW